MSKEQVRNLAGVIIVSALVIVMVVVAGGRNKSSKEEIAEAVQTVAQAVADATKGTASETKAAAVAEAPVPVVTKREADVAGAQTKLAFSQGEGTIMFSGVKADDVKWFLDQESEVIDGLQAKSVEEGKAVVSYYSFSELDDQIVADWLLEDAAALAK